MARKKVELTIESIEISDNAVSSNPRLDEIVVQIIVNSINEDKKNLVKS